MGTVALGTITMGTVAARTGHVLPAPAIVVRTIAERARAVTLRTITLGTITVRAVAVGTITARAVAIGTITLRPITLGTVATRTVAVRTITLRACSARTVTIGTIALRTITLGALALRTFTLGPLTLRGVSEVATTELALGLHRRTIAARTIVVGTVAERAMTAGTTAAPGTTCAPRTTTAFTRALVALAIVVFAAGTRRRGRRHVLVGRRRNDGDALVGQALDALELAALAAVAERDGDARGAGARGAADTMDIAFGIGRQLEIDDVGHALHVDAARGEIGRDEDAGLAAAEIVERLLTGVLRLVAVDRLGAHAAVFERLGDAVGAALGAREDDDALESRVRQQMAEQRPLGASVHEVDALVDLLDRAALRRDFDLLGILQDFRGELGDVARHGRREQQGLPVLGDRGRNAADVADEAHVEHAIGFVADEEADRSELHVAALDEGEQTAGRGDEDVDAARQGLDLAAIAQTADHGAEAQAEAATVGVEAAGDLNREFAGRRQHEGARALGLGALLRLGKKLQHGQRERRRLAGAGLGDAQHVTALQQGGNRARLDGRRHGVIRCAQRAQQRLGQTEIRKRNFTH